MSNSISVREVVMALFGRLGIDRVFGNPGSTELPMFRDLSDDFSYVLGLQESIVVGMADGFARSTGNAALVNLHSAVGVGHGMGNIFTAYKNQTPLIITAGQQARSILPYDPFLFSDRATELPRPYVKWSCEPARAEDVPAAIARAYFIAMQPPRGPVLVSIPVDDWDRPTQWLPERHVSRRIFPDHEELLRISTLLESSQSPALVVGPGVAMDNGWDDAISLAEHYSAPVWVSPMSSLGSFPEDHPLFAGFLPAMREGIVERLHGHDVIVALGAPVFTFHVEGFGPVVPPGSELIQLVNDPQLAAWAPVGTAIVGDVQIAMQTLLSVSKSAARPLRPVFVPAERVTASAGLSVDFLLQTLADLRPDNSILVEEAPSSRPVMHRRLPITQPNSFYTCASGGLGYSLPAAVGIAMAQPERRVIALLGDGSSMYAFQALWTAAQERVPLTIIIVNNGRYQALNDFSKHFGLEKPVGTELSDIDFVSLARSLGGSSLRVTDAEKLAPSLSHALSAESCVLVDVVIQK